MPQGSNRRLKMDMIMILSRKDSMPKIEDNMRSHDTYTFTCTPYQIAFIVLLVFFVV